MQHQNVGNQVSTNGQGGMVGGLDKDGSQFPSLNSAMVRDWKVVAKRIKLLEFNAIRLPFAFAVRPLTA